jgi:hypothetical protein
MYAQLLLANYFRAGSYAQLLLANFSVVCLDAQLILAVRGQTGRVLYWESGFSFVFLICMATYVSLYVAIVLCLCVRLFMCHARLRQFFFNILFSNSIFM